MFEEIVSLINDWVWNPGLVVLLLAAGVYLSIRTRFVQVRRFGLMLKSLFNKNAGKRRGISSFEAFCIALSGRVGTGNIVGVATAIAFGGPGAVFWMWVVAFFGASTAFAESTLSQMYKFPHHSGFRGGPFCFIEEGLKQRWLGVTFAFITFFACGICLTTVQSNGAAAAMLNGFSVTPWVSGTVLAAFLGLVIIGGVKRIARVVSIITPFMALGYILIAMVVIGFHFRDIPAIFSSIFTNAFAINPVCGGIIGSTIAMGVKRGIFSNEAGQGTGAIVSAAADVPHPAQQGLAQAFSVYVDTLLVCTATALMILASGTYNILDARTGAILYASAPELAGNYVAYTQSAVDSVFAGIGGKFVSVAMLFFVFTTIIAYYFYAESGIIYLFRKHPGSRWEWVVIRLLQVFMVGAVVFGAVRETDLIWKLGDIGVGLMAWVTIIAVLLLSPKAIRSLKEYEKTIHR